MQNIIIRNKKYLKFIFIIASIGLLSGIIYYQFLSTEVQNNVINTIKELEIYNSNYIIKDLIIMSVLLVSSFFVIGLPLSIFFIFYESLSIGFLINLFFASFKIKGLIYILIYLLTNRFINIILLILFVQKIINISKLIISLLINKDNKNEYIKIITNFKNSLYIILFVLIINIIMYFISPLLFNKLTFLIK